MHAHFHDFYSRPSARGDPVGGIVAISSVGFLLTPLCEGRLTMPINVTYGGERFLLTPLCEGRLITQLKQHTICPISTHAPLRGATSIFIISDSLPKFLLTPLCEGRRGDVVVLHHAEAEFLLTPLCEGRRFFTNHHVPLIQDFYSRPSARGDRKRKLAVSHGNGFLLTPLCEGRPRANCAWLKLSSISTHAPLRGAT